MLSRRHFLLAGGTGLGAGAAVLAFGTPPLAQAGTDAVATSVADALAAAPAPFVALADQLSGQIGVDRVLVNRVHQTLGALLPQLDALTPRLAAALPRIAGLADPAARLQALADEDATLKELFLRMNTALYLGTVDDHDGTRACIGFENLASFQAVSDFVQPPSYCTGSPNFWVDPPAAPASTKEPAANV
jgi:hypothetical protein